MKEFSQEAEQVMIERFGKDTIISLATTENATQMCIRDSS